jgi:hypothetical protein
MPFGNRPNRPMPFGNRPFWPIQRLRLPALQQPGSYALSLVFLRRNAPSWHVWQLLLPALPRSWVFVVGLVLSAKEVGACGWPWRWGQLGGVMMVEQIC